MSKNTNIQMPSLATRVAAGALASGVLLLCAKQLSSSSQEKCIAPITSDSSQDTISETVTKAEALGGDGSQVRLTDKDGTPIDPLTKAHDANGDVIVHAGSSFVEVGLARQPCIDYLGGTAVSDQVVKPGAK